MLLMLQRNTGVPVFPDGTEGGRGDANPCANALILFCVGSGSGDPAVTPARREYDARTAGRIFRDKLWSGSVTRPEGRADESDDNG